MDWMVLLPIIESIALTAGVFIAIYKIPPGWVKGQADAITAQLGQLASPSNLGDAIHHAVMKDDAKMLAVVGQEANGLIYDNLPKATELLAKEAMHALGSMYEQGYAKRMQEKSGAARGYLSLPGFSKHAAKAGLEGLAGGALGNFLPPEIAALITPEMIQGVAAQVLSGGNNGAQQQQQANVQPQMMMGSPV